MLEVIQNLQVYCKHGWVSKLSVHILSPASCERRAQEARERRERRESGPSISERIPKLKVEASVLPAAQTPKPLTGRGGGKKNPDLFAGNYFPAHRHGKGITKPYELLRPAKRAAPPPPASAAGCAATTVVYLGRDRARSPERIDTSPACDPYSEQIPLPLIVSPP